MADDTDRAEGRVGHTAHARPVRVELAVGQWRLAAELLERNLEQSVVTHREDVMQSARGEQDACRALVGEGPVEEEECAAQRIDEQNLAHVTLGAPFIACDRHTERARQGDTMGREGL